jgi:FeS assembly SUF system protein
VATPEVASGGSTGNLPPDSAGIEDRVIDALRTCFDPEIPVNIYELGLIYGVTVEPSGHVGIRMTLTSPHCPVAASLPMEVEDKVRVLPGVTAAKVEITWDPPWDPSLMSEAARLQLGML